MIKKKGWGFTKCGHFPCHCLVSFNMEHSELVRILQRKGYGNWATAIEDDENNFLSDNNMALYRKVESKHSKNNCFIILLKDLKLNDEGYITIAHETFHIVQFVSAIVCADLYEEKESSAYLQTHLMESAIQVVRKALKS